jgi:hypothetical protein
MNTVELLQFSLDNAFSILGQVVEDVTQEQADWYPPGIANPIGGTYWHLLTSVDQVVHKWCRGMDPLEERDGWREKALTVSAPEPEHGGDYRAYLLAIRLNLPVVHDYAQALHGAVKAWLGTLTPGDLEQGVQTPFAEMSLDQLLTTFVIWHIDAHCGEIAALKGCQGASGYPF